MEGREGRRKEGREGVREGRREGGRKGGRDREKKGEMMGGGDRKEWKEGEKKWEKWKERQMERGRG